MKCVNKELVDNTSNPTDFNSTATSKANVIMGTIDSLVHGCFYCRDIEGKLSPFFHW